MDHKLYFDLPLKSKVEKNRPRFNLDLPVYTFKEEGEGIRVLVVIDYVPTADIDGGTFLSQSSAGYMIEKIMYDANADAGSPLEEIAFVNFHEFRLNGLDPAMRAAAESDFTYRVEKFIKKFKPDIVIGMGRIVAESMLGFTGDKGQDDPGLFFGRVIPLPNAKKLTGKKTKFIYTLGTFDFSPDIRQDRRKEDIKRVQSLASLAGIVRRHFEYAFHMKSIHNISKKPFKTVFVDTMEKFDAMMAKMEKPDLVNSVDTETSNLTRVVNKLLSIQFAFEKTNADPKKIETAYFLLIDHPEARWTKKEKRKVKLRLRHYFEKCTSHCLIAQNSKFDLTQIAQQLGVRFCNHDVYGVDNGQYALEENYKFIAEGPMKHLGVRPYRLDHIIASYGWLAYKGLNIDKSNRNGFQEMQGEDFLRYACTDVIGPLRVRRAQMKRAKHEGFDPVVFERAVTGVLSDMEHVFSDMERTGHIADIEYLNDAVRPNGVIDKLRTENLKQYRTSKSVRRVNKRLLKDAGAPKTALFGGEDIGQGKTPWEFSIRKPAHQQALFFNEMGLAPVKKLKDGGGSVDKGFLEKYGSYDDEGNPTPEYVTEVGWYKELKTFDTVMNTFIKPLNRQTMVDPDCVEDGRVRSNYGFRQIITGRSGSSRDKSRDVGYNGQNIPSRGKAAKAVKRIFVCGDGKLYLKVDFGAHEVRNWSNISGDSVLGDRFKEALRLKRKFTIEVEPEKLEKLVKLLKTRGDIHILNVKFFFNKWVDKDHKLRYQIKAVVFGVMYGKGAFSLADDIKDTEEAAQALIDKLFSTFKEGGDWIQGRIQQGRNEYIIDTPFGLKRHLWGHYSPDEGVRRAMDRRGPNCVDLETECLTAEGWKTVHQLRVGELIYTKNIQTGELELQPLKEVKLHNYKGKMWRLDKGIDALVTPNHRWLVDWGKGGSDRYTKKSVVATSEQLNNSANNNPIHLVADGPINQKGKKWTDEEASIIGWVMSDGYYEKGKSRVRITQSERGNPHKVEIIDKLLPNASKTGPDSLGKIVWTVPTELGKRIREAMPEKIMTGEFLNELSTRQLQLLYDALMLGNGSTGSTDQETFCAGAKEKADMFMMLCVMLGIPCNSHSRTLTKSEWQYASMNNVPDPQAPCWYVQIKKRKYSQAVSNRNQWEDFDGEVWCPNVENSTFIARRNGSVYVTGNTVIQGVSSQMGYMAGRILQRMKWEYFTEPGLLLPLSHNNSVHDSLEMEDDIRTLPVSLYLVEHAMTTQVAKVCREKYDFKLQVDLDVEFELGGTLAELSTWNQRYSDLPALVEDKLKWTRDNLGHKLPKAEWRAFMNNCDLMSQLRSKEIMRDLKRDRFPSETMMIDKQFVDSLDLKRAS